MDFTQKPRVSGGGVEFRSNLYGFSEKNVLFLKAIRNKKICLLPNFFPLGIACPLVGAISMECREMCNQLPMIYKDCIL